MKIAAGTNLNSGSARRERGSIVLILLLLLAIMGMYLASNNLALHQLHRDLQLMEQQQLEKFVLPADKKPTRNRPVNSKPGLALPKP